MGIGGSMGIQLSRRCLLIALSLLFSTVFSYPTIWEMEGSYNNCFNYGIPEDDDATFVVVAIPGDSESENISETQDFYINKIVELGSNGGEAFGKDFGALPDDIETKIVETTVDENNRALTRVLFTSYREEGELLTTKVLDYYKPHLVNEVVGLSMQKGYGDSPPLAGYRFCFKNPSGYVTTLLFDIVHWNDEDDDDESSEPIIEKRHLTPLETSFKKSVDKASQIVDEMKYMERRSNKNMKQDEFYRSFVSKFSMLSVVVLIFTAWVQVMYLKRYFKKKKLL